MVSSIIAGYDIDFTHCIMEEIHERALMRSRSILFPYLIQRLCMEMRVEIFPNIDMIINVQRTYDASLIKANENPGPI